MKQGKGLVKLVYLSLKHLELSFVISITKQWPLTPVPSQVPRYSCDILLTVKKWWAAFQPTAGTMSQDRPQKQHSTSQASMRV